MYTYIQHRGNCRIQFNERFHLHFHLSWFINIFFKISINTITFKHCQLNSSLFNCQFIYLHEDMFMSLTKNKMAARSWTWPVFQPTRSCVMMSHHTVFVSTHISTQFDSIFNTHYSYDTILTRYKPFLSTLTWCTSSHWVTSLYINRWLPWQPDNDQHETVQFWCMYTKTTTENSHNYKRISYYDVTSVFMGPHCYTRYSI